MYTGLPSEMYDACNTLITLLQQLSLEISQSKLVSPTTCAVCLGIEINTINLTLKIPSDKLLEIQRICAKFATKNKVTKNQLQSLLGSLLYITKCVQPARFFLNRMLQLFRDHISRLAITLNVDFHRDLNWFNTFLPQYNGVTFYDHQKPHHTVYLDAFRCRFNWLWRFFQFKLVSPTTCAICLGIKINTINLTLKIPSDKLFEIQRICAKFATKSKVTKTQLQSLLGSLLYLTKCVQPARFFPNRMLQLFRDHISRSAITLNVDFHRDLNWFNTFLPQYNGVTFYDHQKPHHTVHLDVFRCMFNWLWRFFQFKLVSPTTCAISLGIEISTINLTLKIPSDKLFEIQRIYAKFATKSKVTKNNYSPYWVHYST